MIPASTDNLIPQTIEILAELRRGRNRIVLPGLKGSAAACIVAELLRSDTAGLLVLTADQEAADEFSRELGFFGGSDATPLSFPAWDMPPLTASSPHPDISGTRLDTLFRLQNRLARVVVLPVAAALQRVLPLRTLGEASCYLVAGEEFEREELLARLVRMGYANAPLVEDRGTFAVRGGILDIFPPNLTAPVRIEFFGDTVETIRSFDPLTQRSLQPLEELVLLPSREVLLTDEVLEGIAPRLKACCDELEIPADRRRAIQEDLKQAVYFQGVEFLQPLLHPGLETIFDYAPGRPLVLLDPEAIREAAERFGTDIENGLVKARAARLPHAPPQELYLSPAALETILAGRACLELSGLSLSDAGQTASIAIPCEDNGALKVTVSKETSHALAPLSHTFKEWLDTGYRVIVTCHQRAQAERLRDLLAPYGIRCIVSEAGFPETVGAPSGQPLPHQERNVAIILGDISRGFRLPASRLALIAEEELFGKRVRRRGISEVRKKQILSSLAELKPGDHMVHVDHGIGLYRGLQHISVAGVGGDFLLLEYAGSDKLYLPVDRLGLVQRYVGPEGGSPSLDKLGGSGWEKSKGKARKAIEELAGELLEIYAQRQICEGFAFSPPDELYREFEASFAWEETPDQLAAIQDVLADMQHTRPMDRLVCGDVGYGKTEVALRGAFKSALDGKQVGVLVPTTILAQQHYETFHERLKDYPVTVEVISRFRTPKEQKAILERLKKGDIDIIIGTHRLLQKDVAFKDLGLLIVDEEQRFGVKDKERLKAFRAVVDVMTLTATPIPRTLYMSMMGIRDLSIIDTPPVDRLAIKTFVARFSEELIREAIMRELRRGGQVFFVHNRVTSIAKRAEQIAAIVPEARIAVGHGQMGEHELEKVMLGFMHGETNLLICTTIIESGLDIPNANTLIIDRADTFGLSQLYQLRGRVGRSSQRGYAYLLIPGESTITSDARERLKILQDISELGAGFRIATHDMEIRGAGDMLGSRQSGTVTEIGFELYNQMLEETICRLRGEEMAERVEPEINLKVPAFIPEAYIRDTNQRLVIYKKLTQAESEEDILDVQNELGDRFGAYPLATAYLFEVMRLRIMLKRLLVRQIDYDGRQVIISFHPRTPAPPDTIITMMRTEPRKYQFTPDYRLTCQVSGTAFEDVLATSKNVLQRLMPPAAAP
ncbi:transcription-repair coupling factor [Geobacter sp. SVR]|uniref:transcription-repair coupling factor n=1 Tax=Geobacter sp. SVR TaxID=2495594 RepID=UPI00143EFB6E|nr:transcription-repair coupling factor [Geobacter sp. SVR]BCS52250.1 transcription-repair-coupling factor [Geobacter sp. SVR]GCF85089.1 transcription-repair-coupling factor [Geobacter sp. SVR]